MLDAITKKQIKAYVVPYLKLRIPDFLYSSQKGLFTCPICRQQSANIYPVNSGVVRCYTPTCGQIGDIFDLCRLIDFNNQKIHDDDLADLLIKELKITTDNQINEWFQKYQKWGWSLVPCSPNKNGYTGKEPNIEKEWQNKTHKDIREWQEWYAAGKNFGRKEGPDSNTTTVDIDTKDVPEELKKYLNTTLMQTTKKGYHLTYLFEQGLPSCNLRHRKCNLPVEIRSDGGFQTIIYPSIAEGAERSWNDKEPTKMPDELREWLMARSLEMKEESTFAKTDEPNLVSYSGESLKVDESNFTFDKLNGNRNNTFLQFGGILRRYYSVKDVERIMTLVNNGFIDKALPQKEIKAMMKELAKYNVTDMSSLSRQVFDYLVKHEEATAKDLVECLRNERRDIQEVLATLIKEGKVYKQNSLYKAIQKVEWKTEFLSESKILDFKIPYFQDYATFRRGDMICIGAGTGVGKGHVAMNIIKQYVEQGIKPNYVSSEPGNRFASIALTLNLKEGDFNFHNNYNPEKLELEDESITIFDWILPDEFKDTAQLYRLFAKQLDKHGGLLYAFSQLNDKSNDFYASSMVKFFSAFAVKYSYTKVNGISDNINTYFTVVKARESKINKQEFIINTKYDPDTKLLSLRKNT